MKTNLKSRFGSQGTGRFPLPALGAQGMISQPKHFKKKIVPFGLKRTFTDQYYLTKGRTKEETNTNRK